MVAEDEEVNTDEIKPEGGETFEDEGGFGPKQIVLWLKLFVLFR